MKKLHLQRKLYSAKAETLSIKNYEWIKNLLILFCLIWTSQLSGQTVYSFDGVNDYATVSQNGNGVLGDFSDPHDFTVEIRFSFPTMPSNHSPLVAKHSSPHDGFFIEPVANSELRAGMASNNSLFIFGDSPTNSMMINTWYTAALVLDNTAGEFKYYLDGVLLHTLSLPGGYEPEMDFGIALARSLGYGGYTSVNIDFFRIWTNQQTQAQIDANKLIEVDCNSTDLLLQYKFDYPSGSTVMEDCTANNNDGMLIGGPVPIRIIESAQSGGYEFPATWVGGVVPIATDNVIINNGHIVDTQGGGNTHSFNQMTIRPGGELRIIDDSNLESSGGITNEGNILITGSPTFQCTINGDITNNGAGDILITNCEINSSNGTFTNNATVNFNNGTINRPFVNNASAIAISSGNAIFNSTMNNSTGSFDTQSTNNTIVFNDDVINGNQMTGSGSFRFASNVNVSGTGSLANVLIIGSPVTFSGTQTITGDLGFAGGGATARKLILQNQDLTVQGSFSNFGSSRYIITSGTGRVISTISGSGIIPIGTDVNNYNPVTFSQIGDQFAVKVKTGIDNSAFNNDVVNVQWDIDRVSGSNSNAVILQWNAAQEMGNFAANRSNCGIARWNGSAYENFGFDAAMGANPFFRSTDSPINSFSPFIVGSISALPVELVDFNAQLTDNRQTLLSWNTASEINNEGFEIEHSTDAKDWQEIGFVKGNGTTSNSSDYQFVHPRPSNGMNYYRLKQMDFDGKFDYSNIQFIRYEDQEIVPVQVFPNPVRNGNITVKLAAHNDEKVSIEIFDLTGRIWYQQAYFTAQNTINVQDLPAGLYLVQVANNGQIARQKVVIE